MKKCYWSLVILFSTFQIIPEQSESDQFVSEQKDTKRGLSLFMPYGRITPSANGSASTISGVPGGGTGKNSFVPYALLAGGVTSQSPLQQVSGVGTAGQVLTFAGPNLLPEWQDTGIPTGTVPVSSGGTGLTSLTPYGILLGGESDTAQMQQVSDLGTAGQVLMSNGDGVLPSWGDTLLGYVANTGFLFAGTSGTLPNSPDQTTIISNTPSGFASIDIDAIQNTFIGSDAGPSITTGIRNTGCGFEALRNCTSGQRNVGVGASALSRCTQGSFNVAVGNSALTGCLTGTQNVAIGQNALLNCTGSQNVAVGFGAGASLVNGSNNMYLGNAAVASSTESNVIVIGNSSHTSATMRGISGQSSISGVAVLVNSSGKLGTTTSSRRFKENIELVDSAVVEKLSDLEVVQFTYKNDETNELNYGLIAEDVEPIFPEMIVYDQDGEVNTIQYHKLVPLLIKQVQLMKSEYDAQISTLQSRITELEARMNN